MWQRILIAAALFGMAGQAAALGLDLNLSNDTAQIGVTDELRTNNIDESEVGAAIFFNDDSEIVGSGYWHITGRLREGFEPVRFGAGVKAYLADLDHADEVVALALGGSLRLDIPETQIPLAVSVQAHYAPDITTSGDAETVIELTSRLEARFARSASAYIGYRYLRFELENARDRRLDDDFHIGLRMEF